MLAQGRWDVLALRAIAEEDEVHVAGTPHKRREFRRAAGEALSPRESLSTLEGVRLTIGEGNFAAQYQRRTAGRSRPAYLRSPPANAAVTPRPIMSEPLTQRSRLAQARLCLSHRPAAPAASA